MKIIGADDICHERKGQHMNNNCLCHIFDDNNCTWVIILAIIIVLCCCCNG